MDEEEKEQDQFVHATSESVHAPQVTFVKDFLVAVKLDHCQMNMKPTQGMTFLTGRTKTLPPLPFQDLGGQYVAIFGLICNVRS